MVSVAAVHDVTPAPIGSGAIELGQMDAGHGGGRVAATLTSLVPGAVVTLRGGSMDHDGVMALCVAVLVAAFVALLCRLAARRTITPLVCLSKPTVGWANLRGRDRDPPSLTVLSIQRC